jgi:hypothetical protein
MRARPGQYCAAVVPQHVRHRDLRLLAGGVLAAAAVWPLLPAHPPLSCPLRNVTGIPCPLCGATRAVVAAVEGDVWASLRYNPIGVLVVVLAIALVVRPALIRLLALPQRAVVGGLGALWVYNLTANPTFA